MTQLFLAYNENFEVTNAQMFESENTIPFVKNDFIKAKVNPETKELYEGATEEDIIAFNNKKVPQIVTNLQLRIALIRKGFNIEDITNYIKSMPEDSNKKEIIELWEKSTTMKRTDDILVGMSFMLGFTEETLNELFIVASTV